MEALAARVATDGGAALAIYREPFGGHWVLVASLPIDKVEPTPYQRELSETHAARLEGVIEKVGRFLDPVIAVPRDEGFWTPNGMHRLMALRRLGAKAIVALIVPEPEVAFRILALNTEKAHALKDKSLEVIRMARALSGAADSSRRPEGDWAFEFEEPAYLTLGLCYEERPRFSGGAYLPVLKRCEEFSSKSIAKSLDDRAERAGVLLELDDAVVEIVARLKEAGLRSAYLKPFVVARLNPLRFVGAAKPGQKAPRAAFEATMGKMLEAARKFDVSKVRPQDLAALGGAPTAEE
jgi:ParB family chromosome partitioning protein